ncbi:MAG: TraB/GumN family protein [Lentisphaerae bacterium]|nr:TraB/GumN family protein [Lentisphaerota bacterium]
MSKRISRFTVRYLLACLTVLFFSLISLAGDEGKSFLWEAKSADATIYILGSLHLCKPEIYPLCPVISAAYESSDILAVEININDPKSQMKALAIGLQKGMYKGDKNLGNSLSGKSLARLKMFLAENGIQYDLIQQMKPWYLSVFLTMREAGRLGYKPADGMDLYFLKRAAADKKTILALEKIDEQYEVLAGESDKIQEIGLMATLDEIGETEEMVASMTRAWIAGDAEALHKIIDENRNKTPELESFYKKMFEDRNAKMVEKLLLHAFGGNRLFVVVGSGHLVGEQSIPVLLEQKGFIVRQMECAIRKVIM